MRLGELVTFTGGGTPSRSNPDYFGGDIPWVTPKDMKKPELTDSLVRITKLGLRESAARLIPPNSVLIVVRSGVLKHSVPIAINRVPVTLNQDMKALIAGPRLYPEYLAHYLRSITPVILGWVRATTADNFPVEKLRELPLPLPALSEQRRISHILNQVESLRSARHSSLRLLSDLVIAAFAAHFTSAELADRVPLSQAYAIPPNYGTMIPPAETGGFLSLRVKSIQNASLDLSDIKYVDLPLKDRPRHSVEDGDLLMARAIGSLDHLGKCVVAYPGDARWAFDSHLMRIRLNQTIALPEYLRVWLLTPEGRAAFLQIARRSAVQYNVNTKEIAAFLVPMPPIAKQQEFVEFLHTIEAEERRLMTSSLAHLDELFGSLQCRAFTGAL